MPLLQVEGLSKHFYIDHLQREIAVFDALNFTLEAGQFMLIGGANGAGKSSLLRCLYRTYLPSAGSAMFQSKHGLINLARAADVDIAVLRREEMGFVTQFLRPRPRVSAVELVAGYSKGRAIAWGVDVPRLARAACEFAGRDLTQEEWKRLVGASVPYDRTCGDARTGFPRQ